MTKTDDNAISMFMKEQKQEIPDNGFSRRVMRSLPDRSRLLNRIWSCICIAISIVLFFIFNGFEVVFNLLREIFTSSINHSFSSLNQQTLIMIGAILLILGIRKVCTIEL